MLFWQLNKLLVLLGLAATLCCPPLDNPSSWSEHVWNSWRSVTLSWHTREVTKKRQKKKKARILQLPALYLVSIVGRYCAAVSGPKSRHVEISNYSISTVGEWKMLDVHLQLITCGLKPCTDQQQNNGLICSCGSFNCFVSREPELLDV